MTILNFLNEKKDIIVYSHKRINLIAFKKLLNNNIKKSNKDDLLIDINLLMQRSNSEMFNHIFYNQSYYLDILKTLYKGFNPIIAFLYDNSTLVVTFNSGESMSFDFLPDRIKNILYFIYSLLCFADDENNILLIDLYLDNEMAINIISMLELARVRSIILIQNLRLVNYLKFSNSIRQSMLKIKQ